MRFRGLDLNLLIALEALLAERSVSLAAIRVHRSQSAMSGSLARLRDHFRDELLVPVGHRMLLTSFAEGMVEPVRALMEQIDRTVDISGSFNPVTSNCHFTLCVSDYIVESNMPEISLRAATLAPGTMLDILVATASSYELVESGQVDLLVAGPRAASPALPTEIVLEEDYVILAWEGNEKLQEAQITEAEFFNMRRVVGRFGAKRTYSTAEDVIQKIGGKANIEVVAPSNVAIPNFLPGTNRVALLNRSLAQAAASKLPLIIRPAPFNLPPFRFVIQNHPARAGDAGLEWLKSIIRESFAPRAQSSSVGRHFTSR